MNNKLKPTKSAHAQRQPEPMPQRTVRNTACVPLFADKDLNADAVSVFFRSRLRMSQLRVLVAIDERKQLRKVADDLHVTPPAISKQVADIEAALGQPVLRRVGNSVEFTEVGALLARRARDVIRVLDRTEIELHHLCTGVRGRPVGLGAAPTIAPLFLPALVYNLRQEEAGIDIRLEEGPFDRLAPLLESGVLDIVVARETSHALAAGFDQREVLADPLAVVCGRQHWLADAASLTWDDLREARWVVPTQGTTTFAHLEQLMRHNGIELPRGCIQSQGIEVNIVLLETIPLLALVPLAQARPFLQSGRINALPISTGGMMGSIKAVWRKGDTNPAVGNLLEAIKHRARLL